MAIGNNDRIDGWREIAVYLGRDERTAKRWEKQRGLPVRRIPGEGRASVYVLRREVDAWLEQGVDGRGADALELDADQSSEVSDPAPAAERRVLAVEEPDLGATDAVGSAASAERKPDDQSGAAEEVVPDEAAGSHGGIPPQQTTFRPSQHVSLMVSLFGLLLLLAASAVRFFHLGPLESILFASESAIAVRTSPKATPAERDEHYLRAVYLCERRSAVALEEARGLFTEAIDHDRNDAASYAGLAKTDLLLREYGTMPEAEAYQAAKEAAAQAVALDPQLGDAHAELGFIAFFWSKQPDEAEREFKLALMSQDQSALAHHWYGSMLMHQGRQEEALRQLTLAQQRNPTSTAILASKALALGFSGHREEGVQLLEQIQRAGDNAMVHRNLAYLSLIAPRDTGRFLAESRRFAELRQDAPMVAVLRSAEGAFATEGETAMWRTVLREERAFHPNSLHPSYLMAEAEAMLGHEDAALQALEHLSADRDGRMLGIVLEPAFASLHKDAAFARMAEGMGLVSTATAAR